MFPCQTTRPGIACEVAFERCSKVFLLLSSANRDTAYFLDPDRFDIARNVFATVAFGVGPHFCVATTRYLFLDEALAFLVNDLPNLNLTVTVSFPGRTFRNQKKRQLRGRHAISETIRTVVVLALLRAIPIYLYMIRVLPILLAIGYAFAMYRFSAWRTAKELDARSSELVDPSFSSVSDRMARALDLPRIKVHIYEIEPINGLAAPDGRIFITRGFYNKFRSGDVTAEELASVIAHELGHVALGHSRRRMIDFSGQNAVRTALAMVLGRFIPLAGVWIANMLTTLLAARLSRGDEYEADAYAAALLTKAEIGIGPQISLFEKLDQMTASGAGSAPAWLLSHPKSSERIKALRKLESRWQA